MGWGRRVEEEEEEGGWWVDVEELEVEDGVLKGYSFTRRPDGLGLPSQRASSAGFGGAQVQQTRT